MGASRPEFRVVILPNRSCSGRNMACMFCLYMFVCAVISVIFALDGAWLVAPFMGLEVIVIGVVLASVSYHANDREIVVIDGDRVEIAQITGRAERCVSLQRYWARVRLETQADDWYPTRLLVGSHGRWVEIGSVLTDDERLSLSKRLNTVLRAQPAIWADLPGGREAGPGQGDSEKCG
ncbi:MAG: DUF2244 domain-containing protein [Gammaproteobacteria bacterium]|nr:DUF2244 domain-containing protein [Gammaproteobacteria bacterium]